MKSTKFNARARRNELDKFWSRLVKARDGHKCRRCGSGEKLQSAHIHGRRSCPSVRWHAWNGVCLCVGCHYNADQRHRAHFYKWVEDEWLGQEKYMALLRLASKPGEPFGPTRYGRELRCLNEWAAELGEETQ